MRKAEEEKNRKKKEEKNNKFFLFRKQTMALVFQIEPTVFHPIKQFLTFICFIHSALS